MKYSAFVLTLWIAGGTLASARPWTNTKGKVIEAEMVSADGESVELKLPSARVVKVSLASLRAEDQEFIKSRLRSGGVRLPRISVEKRVWPDTVQVPNSEIEKVELVKHDGPNFIYRSTSFEFSSQAKLLPSLIKEVARTFESTKRLVDALPWGIRCRPPVGMDRYLAALFETRSAYIAAGGPSNSSGVYMLQDKTFRIPFESLGIKKMGQSYTRDSNFNNNTLVHEITHQMMHEYLLFLPMWAVEGTAEFTEMMPYKSGTFRVKDHEKGLKAYFEWQGESPLIRLPRLKDLFRMTHETWNLESRKPATDDSFGGKSRQHELYEQSALLVYYFNFLDGGESEQGHRWMRFLDAVNDEIYQWNEYEKAYTEYLKQREDFMNQPGVKKNSDGKIQYPSHMTPPQAPSSSDGKRGNFDKLTPIKHLGLLLDGRSEEALENEMASKFTKIGLKVSF